MCSKFLFVAFVVALSFNAAFAADDVTDPTGSDVVILNSDNFDEKVSNGVWLIEFYAPWCGHCKTLAPIFKEVATKLKGRINLGAVDMTKNPTFSQRFGIRGFPTIKLFRYGPAAEPKDYAGQRTADGFTQWLTSEKALDAAPPKLVLRYFKDLRGRAEVIRYLLEDQGIKYEDQSFTFDEWPAEKKAGIDAGRYVFGQLPSFSFDDTNIVQSQAILRFIGGRYGLLPKDEPSLTKIDMALGGAEDFKNAFFKLTYDKAFDSLKDEYIKTTMPTWLGHFQKFLGGKFVVGDKITVADYALLDPINLHLGLVPGALNDFPKLSAWHAAMLTRPRLAAYLTSGRRPSFDSAGSAFWGNAKYPSHPVVAGGVSSTKTEL